MSKIKVLVVDDQQILRNGLTMILNLTDDLEVVGSAANGVEGIKQIESVAPDVVLSDIRMPEMDGIQMLTELKRIGNSVPVVMLTTFDDQGPIQEALKLGAKGFLLKDSDEELITSAIRGAVNNQVSLDPNIIAKALSPTATAEEQITLTDREFEVLNQVAQGLHNQEIADQMHLSERTIKVHLTSVYSKLQVETRAEAVAKAMKLGIIKL